jgi:hypothetical protein
MVRTRKLVSAALVLGMFGLTSMACTTGYAYGQPPYRDRGPYGNGGYSRGWERQAYDTGYRDGLRRGERDARSNRRYDPTRHGDWKDADDGYRREYGDHNLYRRSFRSGFEAGYAQSYRQYGRDYRRW